MTASMPARLPCILPPFPLISSSASGFFFCGIKLLPAVRESQSFVQASNLVGCTLMKFQLQTAYWPRQNTLQAFGNLIGSREDGLKSG